MFAQNKRFVEKHTRENKGEGERENERERERESNGETLWTKGLHWERFWGERIKEAEGIQNGRVRGFFVLFSGVPALLTEGCKD